ATTALAAVALHDALPILAGRGEVHRLELRDHRAVLAEIALTQRQPEGIVDRRDTGLAALRRNLHPPRRSQIADDGVGRHLDAPGDRKSTRLNSSHVKISY